MPRAISFRFSLLAAIICLFAVPVSANAADPLGPVVQISNHGPPGDLNFQTAFPAVAASTRSDSQLIVWVQSDWRDDTTAMVWGQLTSQTTGAGIGGAFQISDAGTNNSAAYDYNPPNVTYNSVADEYLVGWNNSSDSQVFVKRVSGAGVPIGADIPIADVGYSDIETVNPSFSPEANRYLVVWKGTSGTQQARGQLLSGVDASEIGTDIQISQMSANADDAIGVAYSPQLQRFMVVWRGRNAPIATEYEIYQQQLTTDGVEVGSDMRVSDAGPDGNASYNTAPPSVEWNPIQSEWLVAWNGSDNVNGQVQNENEVMAQRLSAAGLEVGENDFRVSHMGPDGNTTYSANRPRLAFNTNAGEYAVTWHGDDNTVSNADDQFEVYSQRLSGTGALVGERTQLTDFTPDAQTDGGAVRPSIAYAPRACNWTITYFQGDMYPDTNITLYEEEIYARTLQSTPCPQPPPVSLCPAGTSASVVCTVDSDGKGLKMVGTAAGETFIGTGEGDNIIGGGGKDKIRSGKGKDKVNGGSGNDDIAAGDGNDSATGGSGKDKVKGGKGNDSLKGGKGNDKLYGQSGKDKLFGEAGNDLLNGGAGADKIAGGKGTDRLICGAGKDKVIGKTGDKVAGSCKP